MPSNLPTPLQQARRDLERAAREYAIAYALKDQVHNRKNGEGIARHKYQLFVQATNNLIAEAQAAVISPIPFG